MTNFESDHQNRRSFLSASLFGIVGAPLSSLFVSSLVAADDKPKLSADVSRYLNRIYAEGKRSFRFRDDYQGGFPRWQAEARAKLEELLGLPKIASSVGQFQPMVTWGESRERGNHTLQKVWIETEPDVRIPFWMLKPNGDGPFPLALLPHGHDKIGHDTHAGVVHNEAHRKKIVDGQRDVAAQAVERGFLAIAPATRGLGVDGVPDVFGRHDKRDCRSQLMHCLLAGRTAIGERVWDLKCLLDFACALPEVNGKQVLMMGNSGGGMATLYAAACDERISVAVPSCSYTTATSPGGKIYHCDCNLVPGLLEWGDLYDVAGLVAPRWMLAVNGRKDKLHEADSIERAAAGAKAIFQAAGVGSHFEHRWGAEGHRFYSDLMWPFIMQAIKNSA